MKKRPFQLARRHQRCLYVVAGGLFLSGAFWWFADRGWMPRRPDEDFIHTAKLWLLKFHGGAAMAFLILLGTLWPNHIRRAWHARQNHWSGVALLLWIAALIGTGYGLYYFGDEAWREWTARVHDVLGFAAALVLVVHVWSGHRSARRADYLRHAARRNG